MVTNQPFFLKKEIMALGEYIMLNLWFLALNWYSVIIIGLLVTYIYVTYFKTNYNTDIDLMKRYVKLELMRRYK